LQTLGKKTYIPGKRVSPTLHQFSQEAVGGRTGSNARGKAFPIPLGTRTRDGMEKSVLGKGKKNKTWLLRPREERFLTLWRTECTVGEGGRRSYITFEKRRKGNVF